MLEESQKQKNVFMEVTYEVVFVFVFDVLLRSITCDCVCLYRLTLGGLVFVL